MNGQTSYRFANSLRTALGDTDYDGGNAEENVLDASVISTGVGLRIGDSRVAPILVGTGGILGMSPDGRDDLKQVFVGYGGGVDARIRPWLNGQLLVEDLRFRIDRSTLAGDSQGSGVAPDDDRAASRRSTALTLSFGARLGGGRPSARANALDQDMTRAYSGDGLMVRAEVNGGVLRFDKALLLPERPYFGVRGGLDFGPFFGLRGSYARGAQRDLAGFVGMTSWAGEAQFNVGRITDWSTHLLLGFGQITFDSGFLDESGSRPDDQNALILGAGVGIPVGSRTQLLVSLRDHITTVGEISGVSTPDDLRHNFGLTAGVSFLVRGSPRRPGPYPAGPPRPTEAGSQSGAPRAASSPPAQQAQQATDSLTGGGAAVLDPSGAAAPSPQVADTTGAGRGGYQSDRTVSIPLPTEGELFIRYGPSRSQQPGAPVVTPPVPDTAGAGAGVSNADLAALEQRLAARLDSIASLAAATSAPARTEPSPEVEALTRQVEELARLVRERSLAGPGTTIVPVSGGVPSEVVTEMRDPFFQGLELRVGGSSLRSTGPGASLALDALFGDRVLGPLQPYAGVHLSQVSVDGDLGGSPYDGSVTSYGIGAGARLGLPRLGPVRPSLSLGV
ncbi:MAG: hypothetical protein R3253_16115, partial [Longimicrobiales bacterium]|nr:hypothetical protein [Longimicrobiales bacterium]